MEWATQLRVLVDVVIAMLLGGLIGAERQLADKPAGVRTQMLVCGAAALLVGLGAPMVSDFSDGARGDIRGDPLRIVEAIIAGISFLGAGTIFRRTGSDIQGITTAASLLMSAATGIAVALHTYVLAVGAALLSLLVLRGMRRVDEWFDRRNAK